MKIMSFEAIKGGVGKTTLAYNYGEWLASQGKKILFIDFDFQCNLTQTYKIYQSENTVANIFIGGDVDIVSLKENIDLIPGYMKLDQIEKDLGQDENKNMYMYMWLDDNYYSRQLDQYDYIIFDCRPDFSIATKNATIVSHLVWSPLIPSKYGYEAKYNIETQMNDLRAKAIDYTTRKSFVTAKLVFIANMVKHNTKSSKNLVKILHEDGTSEIIVPYKELFNISTLEYLPLSEMMSKKEFSDHKDFFRKINIVFSQMTSIIDQIEE